MPVRKLLFRYWTTDELRALYSLVVIVSAICHRMQTRTRLVSTGERLARMAYRELQKREPHKHTR